jgi:uncharacterized membrane protein
MKKEDKIPTLNVKLEERIVESKAVYTPWIFIETPYMIFSDKNGTRKIWTKNKKKIVLYYLYQITGIKWFIKKYNEQPR